MRLTQSVLRKLNMCHNMRNAHLWRFYMQTPLRKMRVEKNLTIAEVALATKIDVGNLSRIERGKQITSLDKAKKIAEFFGGAISAMEILYPQQFMKSGSKAA